MGVSAKGLWSGFESWARRPGRPLVAVAVLVGLLLLLGSMAGSGPETVTVRVLGDGGVPYEVTYENNRGSYTDRGTTPGEYTIDVLRQPSADDYVRAKASKLEEARDMKAPDGELVNVDLQLVAEDGTVLDEDSGEGFVGYVLNSTSVEVDGEDVP